MVCPLWSLRKKRLTVNMCAVWDSNRSPKQVGGGNVELPLCSRHCTRLFPDISLLQIVFTNPILLTRKPGLSETNYSLLAVPKVSYSNILFQCLSLEETLLFSWLTSILP